MKAVSILILLLLSTSYAAAQAPLTALEERPYRDKVPAVARGERSFKIEPAYLLKHMLAGHDAKLTITISAPASNAPFLELRGMPKMKSRDSVDKFQFQDDGSVPSNDVVQKRTYTFTVSIDEKAEPRRHQVALAFALPGEPEEKVSPRYFDLYVGVNKNGRLAAVPLTEDAQPPSFETGFFRGHQHTYELMLQNNFADYTVTIESIKIHSEPAELIQPKEFTFENGITLEPSEVKSIALQIDTNALGIKNLIKGLSVAPRLQAEVFYNDGNARRISDLKPRLAITVPPTGSVVFGSVILGLLFGALLRTLLEFMLFKKQITRRGVLKVVSYSLLFGLLLVVFMAVGQVEIKAKTFSMSSSYDNPLAMLAVGLIGALAGLQMIIGWYKSLKVD